jgi:hypothetical protein
MLNELVMITVVSLVVLGLASYCSDIFYKPQRRYLISRPIVAQHAGTLLRHVHLRYSTDGIGIEYFYDLAMMTDACIASFVLIRHYCAYQEC